MQKCLAFLLTLRDYAHLNDFNPVCLQWAPSDRQYLFEEHLFFIYFFYYRTVAKFSF